MTEGQLERIRRAELESVRNHFGPRMRVLEIGGGNGFQAAILSSWECDVVSIDVAGRSSAGQNYFPVKIYDGKTIPFEDQSFDLIFSSNVLEHVGALSILFKEMNRTLKPDGTLLHVLPSPSWRLWTSLTHYVYAVRWLAGIQPHIEGVVEPLPVRDVARQHGLLTVVKQVLFAGPHGEYANAIAEVYYFSKQRWRKVFEENGFAVVEITDCGIFYTGHLILAGLSVATRRRLAAWLGSSCYVIKAKKDSAQM